MDVLLDPSGRFRHAPIRTIDHSGVFVRADGKLPAHWSLLRLRLSAAGAPWAIFSPSGTDSAVAYADVGGRWNAVAFETEIPGRGHVFYRGPPALTIPASWAGRTLYVLALSNAGMSGCLRAAPLAVVLRREPVPTALLLYFGLLGGVALFMLVLFGVSREPFIGWYIAYLASLLLYQLFRADLLWRFGWPFTPWHETQIEFALWGPNMALYAQFARTFLETSRYAKVLDRLLIVAIIGFIIDLPLVDGIAKITGVLIDPKGIIPVPLMCLVAVAVIAATIGRVRQGYRPAAFFLLSYPLLFGFVSLAVWQWLTHSRSLLGLYGAELGTGSECIMLAFAIGDRLRLERRLRRIVGALREVVVRIGRDGRILFATPNAQALLGVPPERLIGMPARRFKSEPPQVLRALTRQALEPGGSRAPLPFSLQLPDGSARRVSATAYADRDRRGRVLEIQLSLNELPAQAPKTRANAQALRIGLFRGEVVANGRAVRVTGRELEILALLALRFDPLPTAELAAKLWPDQTEQGAASTLQTTISRLRKKLPRDSIAATARGYVLGPQSSSDVRDLMRLQRTPGETVQPDLYDALTRPLPAALRRREWFGPYELMLEEARREVLLRHGRSLLERGDEIAALAVAADLRSLDVTDESGYALAIDAHLRADNKEAARRVFEDCRRALKRELNLEPSAAICARLESHPVLTDL